MTPPSEIKERYAALPPGVVRRRVERHRASGAPTLANPAPGTSVEDAVAEEIPVALIYNDRPHAVMLATPADLHDFALGFSLSEAIIGVGKELARVEIAPALAGIELRCTIPEKRAAVLGERVRELTGRTGCGLCGAQTLEAAVRHPPAVGETSVFSAQVLANALTQLQQRQVINQATGATHAAGWVSVTDGLLLVREDVGRHNALDKVIGAMQAERVDVAQGFLIVTSRASFEMVMKSATVGIGALVAISAPTALAIALAEQSNVTLIGFARAEGYSVYAHPRRVLARREPSPGFAA